MGSGMLPTTRLVQARYLSPLSLLIEEVGEVTCSVIILGIGRESPDEMEQNLEKNMRI